MSAICARARLQPSDLKPGEHLHVEARLDDCSDGVVIVAHRAEGYGANSRTKTQDILVSGQELRTASIRGDKSLADVVLAALERLMLRMRFAARPPKGWRLFGRRKR